jgi:cytosine deaminase
VPHPPFGRPHWPEQLPARYWLAGGNIPPALLQPRGDPARALLVEDGRIARLALRPDASAPVFDLDGALVLSAFVDPHVHLDKGDLLAAGLAPQRDLFAAIDAVRRDYARWTAEELRLRIDFGLRTALAHGCRALNSYCDWSEATAPLAWEVLQERRAAWRGRVELRLTCLFPLDLLADAPAANALAQAVRAAGAVLGPFVYAADHLASLLPVAFDLAERHGLPLDFHIDEHLQPAAALLPAAAALARERGPGLRTTFGHACTLPLLDPQVQRRTLEDLAASGATVVCLPATNLYLQDSATRAPFATPRHRGLTAVHELRAMGVPLALGSDNHRDVFFPGGDLDPLQGLALAAVAAQLEDAAFAWADAVTVAPARALGLGWDGVLRAGAPADLVLHPGRTSAEVLARPALGRQVLRQGQLLTPAERELPDFRELDLLREPR